LRKTIIDSRKATGLQEVKRDKSLASAFWKRYSNLPRRIVKDRLISFVLFGSVARDSFRPDSDIDILTIAETLPQGRIRRVQE